MPLTMKNFNQYKIMTVTNSNLILVKQKYIRRWTEVSGIHINYSKLYCISVRHSNTNVNGLKIA